MSAELFGVWKFGADGRVHYFLGGGALCRNRVRDTGRPGPVRCYRRPGGRRTDTWTDTSHDCRDCRAMNFLRWLSVR